MADNLKEKITESVGTTETPVADVPPEPGSTRCTRCGYDHETGIAPVLESDRKEFIRCLLAGKRFKKTYRLFNGEVTLKFRSLKASENECMQRLIQQVLLQDNLTMAAKEMLQVQFLFYFDGMGSQDVADPDTARLTTLEEANALYKERTENLTADIVSLMIGALFEFVSYLPVLTNSGFDDSFWKGAGLE